MPGFVDVSNWSDQDIKRLGQMDDADDVVVRTRRNPRGYNNSNRPASHPVVGYTVSDVWAAACAAQRINGEYLKEEQWMRNATPPFIAKRRSRDVMMDFLTGVETLTDEDREAGEACRKFLQNDITFRTLKGSTNDFDRSVRQVLAVEDRFYTVGNRYELAVVACLPASWQKAIARQNKDERIMESQGGLIGTVGKAVQLNIEVIGSVKSKQWDIYWIQAITDQDQAISFSNKESWDVGTHLTIRGKVKAHRDNLTQLNYVKVL